MPKQTIYLVVNIYDGEDPTPVQVYDTKVVFIRRNDTDQHAAHFNRHLGEGADVPAFAVRELDVLSKFNPTPLESAMTYDSTTQTETPVITLDGTELKIGDEVIIARQPADPETDALWTSSMARLVGRRGVVVRYSSVPESDIRNFGEVAVNVDIPGDNQWWFRPSELNRPHTYHQAAQQVPS